MNSPKFKGLLSLVLGMLLLKSSCGEGETYGCRPLQSKTDPLPPDDRFILEIVDLQSEYIPSKKYKVILKATDEQSRFIAFTISATGTKVPDPKNPRKEKMLNSGFIRKSSDPDIDGADISALCTNAVVEQDKQPKTRVEVEWTAPGKNNKCVTIWAYVAIKPDVWYNNKGPLSKRVCEDRRKDEDMKPRETPSCEVCEQARYELQFQGTWSYNTHPTMYPSTASKVKFSDIVGASHNKAFSLYDDQRVASEGLKMLAEQGNTTLMEREILKYLGNSVRTVIKATGPPKSSLSTITSFRTSRQHHFISLAASIIPSPDWFLGVNNMEMCNGNDWIKEVRYNLYPMDAGTDSGVSFETAPEPTTPPQPIAKAKLLDGEQTPEDMIPFAKLKITLVRTYPNPDCSEDANVFTTAAPSSQEVSNGEETGEVESGGAGEEEHRGQPSEPARPPPPETTTTSPPEETSASAVPEIPKGCEVTAWGQYEECQGSCENNKIVGFRMRERAFVDKEGSESRNCSPYLLREINSCEEECDESETEFDLLAQQGNWKEWAKPGQGW